MRGEADRTRRHLFHDVIELAIRSLVKTFDQVRARRATYSDRPSKGRLKNRLRVLTYTHSQTKHVRWYRQRGNVMMLT